MLDIKDIKYDSYNDLGSKTDLIELVKGYKELYDKSDPLYKNNSHKGVIWASIAKSLGGAQSAKKVREQFSYMRRRFEEEYHARKNGLPRPKLPDPDSANYRKPLFVYEQLTFLEPYIQTERESSYDEQTADVENHPGTSNFFEENGADLTDPNALIDYVRQWAENGISNDCRVDPTTGEILPPLMDIKDKDGIPAKRKRKNNMPPKKTKSTLTPPSNQSSDSPPSQDLRTANLASNGTANDQIDNDMMLQFAKTLSENLMMNNHQMTSTSNDDDECNLFGRQVAMDLKRLNTQNRAVARFRINKILMEMTVQEFQGDETNPLNFD